jgi:hypothetical protein
MMNINEYKEDLKITFHAIEAIKIYCEVLDKRIDGTYSVIKWVMTLSILSWCTCCFILGYVLILGK